MRKNMNGNSSKSVLRSSFLMNCPKDFICLKDISQGQTYSLRRQQTSDLGRLVCKLVNAYINSLAAKLIIFFLLLEFCQYHIWKKLTWKLKLLREFGCEAQW